MRFIYFVTSILESVFIYSTSKRNIYDHFHGGIAVPLADLVTNKD